MSLSSVQSSLLSPEDRERVLETLKALESSGTLPEPVQEPVLRLLRLVAEGQGATVVATDDDLTSTQAAKVLGVSRPFLTKLLDQGRIPFHRTGRDRRIAAKDVIWFREMREESKRRLREDASSYELRKNERLAAAANISSEDATRLGFG